METEKVCVNMSAAELGTLDVLVAQGMYTSRSDVIRAGVRAIADQHEPGLRRVTETATTIGLALIGRRDLEKAVREGKQLRWFVVGILRIDNAVTPELAHEAIEHIQVLGSLRAPQAVIDRLGDRISRNLDASWL